MSVKAINQSITAKSSNQQKNHARQQSFTGSFNPVVTLMDAIDKGGFAASFIAQDGIGMVAPRIYEGLNRNRQKDENGKKTGPLNWEFARREGIREILSGPSAFLIPLGILSVVKKSSGPANNVHVSHLEALGEDFISYASKNQSQLTNPKTFKKGYYSQVFENLLSNSTDNNLDSAKIKQQAQEFADKLINAEELRANKKKKDAKKLVEEIADEYSKIRKSTVASSSNELSAVIKVSGQDKTVNTNIRRLTQSLTDYTNDTLKHVSPQAENIAEAVKKFTKHRAGTRVLTNLGMWSAVVAFYTLIPKLYNMGLKHDPGLKGLEDTNETENNSNNSKETNNKSKDVAFTGLASKAGEAAMGKGKVHSLLKSFEFDGATMPISAMLTLLFGFCLPPRYIEAKSSKERKEILVRDISSFTAILFGAKALSRGFSDTFAKMSGFALNIKPKNHNKNLFNKVKNYFTAGSGVQVLNSEQLVTKYSNIDKYKDGINGFFDFLQENGGNVKKVLNIDNTVKASSEKIMEEFGSKSLKDATINEIQAAFKKARLSNSEHLEKIHSIFSDTNNVFINRAKTYNSMFGFLSTLVLVPAFMMWLARYCEKMTKKAVEKEQAMKQQQQNPAPIQQNSSITIASGKPTMAGFLNN